MKQRDWGDSLGRSRIKKITYMPTNMRLPCHHAMSSIQSRKSEALSLASDEPNRNPKEQAPALMRIKSKLTRTDPKASHVHELSANEFSFALGIEFLHLLFVWLLAPEVEQFQTWNNQKRISCISPHQLLRVDLFYSGAHYYNLWIWHSPQSHTIDYWKIDNRCEMSRSETVNPPINFFHQQ